MGAALPIADHHDASALRTLARREKNGRVASQLAAARSADMDRQTLRDSLIRYNADGIDGLYDQPKGHHPKKLSESERAVLLAIRRVTGHSPISAILPRRVSASGSRHRACGACFSGLVSPIKRRDRFI